MARRFDLNWIGGHDQDAAADLGSARQSPDQRVGDPTPSSSPLPRAEGDPEPAGRAGTAAMDFATALRPDVPDDWDDDDDLLDDSLLAEVTQNPENVCAPKHSSTQKTSCQAVAPLPATPWSVAQSDGRGPLGKFEMGSAGKDSTATCGPSAAVSTTTNQRSSPGPAHMQLRSVPDFSDDGDLDAFFSCEPPWDDPADDDDDDEMLRLCEDLESRVGHETPNRFSVPDRFPIGRPGAPVSTATDKSVCVWTNGTVAVVTGETVSSVTERAVDDCPVAMVMHHPVSTVTSKGKRPPFCAKRNQTHEKKKSG